MWSQAVAVIGQGGFSVHTDYDVALSDARRISGSFGVDGNDVETRFDRLIEECYPYAVIGLRTE